MGRLKKSKASSTSSSPAATAAAATATAPPSQSHDDAGPDLLDDLFAQLDVKGEQPTAPAAGVAPPPSLTNKQTTAAVTASGPVNAAETQGKRFSGLSSKTRFKERQARKLQKIDSSHPASDPAADARLEQEARDEERDIQRICDQLGLQMFEIAPDGHCLFAAVADQLLLHGLLSRSTASYVSTRTVAANYILQHQDDFLPFLPSVDGEDGIGAYNSEGIMTPRQFAQYCANIRDTGAWGGEPEIMALSRAYNIPIHVVQAGKPPVVVHEPEPDMSDRPGTKIVFISYHRRMYGLGEHYNSLRPVPRLANAVP